MQQRRAKQLFYAVFPPLAVTVNLALGVLILSLMRPSDWLGWLEIATGAFCCVVAGMLAATAWSRSYWGRAMSRQVIVWRQMADAIFRWIEDVHVPAEALQALKRSLDDVVPSSGSN